MRPTETQTEMKTDKETDKIRRDVLDHRYFLTSIEKKKRNIFPFTQPTDLNLGYLTKTWSSLHVRHGQLVLTSSVQ